LQTSRSIGATEVLLPHGYKELTIAAGANGEFRLEPHALHIWPRGDFMLIALPNPGGDFTLTLFLPNEGETSFATLDDELHAGFFFERFFPDVAPLITKLSHSVVHNPLGLLGTVRCRRWHDAGSVLLIGDAAHAVVPFHGQGMNLAFEDCVVLERILDEMGTDWEAIFRRYETEQRVNANAIADMALENYVEMRDTVRDPRFALQKELSFELERRLPGRFIPRYSMVMFHADIPYSVAQQRGRMQSQLLEEFTQGHSTFDQIDIDAAEAAAVDRLTPI
jgi:kynurenine 3-monooxygenase